MFKSSKDIYANQLQEIKDSELWKEERVINSPQQSRIDTTKVNGVLNMCANNYLGLSNNPLVKEAAKGSYDTWGYGLSSVRFICGTQAVHKKLEETITEFLETEDTILY